MFLISVNLLSWTQVRREKWQRWGDASHRDHYILSNPIIYVNPGMLLAEKHIIGYPWFTCSTAQLFRSIYWYHHITRENSNVHSWYCLTKIMLSTLCTRRATVITIVQHAPLDVMSLNVTSPLRGNSVHAKLYINVCAQRLQEKYRTGIRNHP